MGKVRNMWEYFNPILKYVSHWTRVTLFYHFIKLRSDDSIEVKPFLREKTRHFSEMINDFHARRDPHVLVKMWRKKKIAFGFLPTLSSHQVLLSKRGIFGSFDSDDKFIAIIFRGYIMHWCCMSHSKFVYQRNSK